MEKNVTLLDDCEVAVIGAGIAGAGVAAHLEARGGVVVLDQEGRAGHHSTGRSAAVFIQNYGNATIRALSRASGHFYRGPGATDFAAPLLSPRKILFVSDGEGRSHLDDLLSASEGLREIGVDEAIHAMPILDPQWLAGAAIEDDASDIDVDAMHQGWLRRVRDGGGRILLDAPVNRAERRDGYWHLDTPKGRVRARVVVNAAGAWADHVASLCGSKPLGLVPMRRSIAVLPAPEGHDTRHWPLTADAADRWYVKPETGRLLVSPADEDPVEPHDAYVDDMVLAEGLHRFEQAVTMNVTRVESSWAGLRTFAPDRTPVAGFDPAAEGFFWLAGQGGYGMQTAPALSALSAAMVEGRTPPAETEGLIGALSPDRF
jgi:D-arginine dehydrogenase